MADSIKSGLIYPILVGIVLAILVGATKPWWMSIINNQLDGKDYLSDVDSSSQRAKNNTNIVVGGLNLNSYCNRKHGKDFRAINPNGGCYTWRCSNGRTQYEISINEACRWQYGSNVEAFSMGSSAGCWKCKKKN